MCTRVTPSGTTRMTTRPSATEFSVGGFSGIAGWSFSDALRAGGTGTDRDFRIDYVSGRLNWFTQFHNPG